MDRFPLQFTCFYPAHIVRPSKFCFLSPFLKNSNNCKSKLYYLYCSSSTGEDSNHSQTKSGPKNGKNSRRCLITRKLLPRDHLWRIVRTRDESGRYKVQLDRGKGRSVYISKGVQVVLQAQARMKLLNQYLRCSIPRDYIAQLLERSRRLENLDSF